MAAILFGVLAALALPASAVAQSPVRWREVTPGIEVTSMEVSHRTPAPVKSVTITALRADLGRVRLKILDVGARSRPKRSQEPTKYDLASLRALQSAPPVVLAALNGGFVTSYTFPQPVGLVISGGRKVGGFSRAALLSGVLCVRGNGSAEILPTGGGRGADAKGTNEGPEFAECTDALQAGPLLVEPPGRNGIKSTEPSSRVYDRSVVCVDTRGRVLFVHTSPTSLFDLAGVLAVPVEKGGFGCTAALNLSGDSDAGLMWREGKTFVNVGSLDAALATAVVIQPRQ